MRIARPAVHTNRSKFRPLLIFALILHVCRRIPQAAREEIQVLLVALSRCRDLQGKDHSAFGAAGPVFRRYPIRALPRNVGVSQGK
jgi:hypothetical protein